MKTERLCSLCNVCFINIAPSLLSAIEQLITTDLSPEIANGDLE